MKTLVGMAFAALVVVGLPPNSSAGVIEVKVDLTMKDSECVAKVQESKKVSKKKRDVLVWTVASTCTTPQEVRLCLWGGKPLRKCNGEPGDAQVGKTFAIEAGTPKTPAYAAVTCHAKWKVLEEKPVGPKTYWIDVLNGPANANLQCPAKTVCVGCEGSELALEVEP
jgi:hypothetical protein